MPYQRLFLASVVSLLAACGGGGTDAPPVAAVPPPVIPSGPVIAPVVAPVAPIGVSLVTASAGLVSSLAVDAQGVVTAFGTPKKYLPSGEVVARAVLPGEGPFSEGVHSTHSWVLPERDGGFVVANALLIDNFNFVTPAGGTIARVSASGTRTVLASWTASSAIPHTLEAVAVDAAGTVYFVDYVGHALSKLTSDGAVVKIADLPLSVSTPSLAVSPAGELYVMGGNAVRKLDAQGNLVVVAGSPGNVGIVDGTASVARFAGPGASAFDAAGNLFVADQITVRKVTPAGVVTTVAGQPTVFTTTTGPLPASFGFIKALAVGPDGLLYVTVYNSATVDYMLLRIRLQ